jgi:PRC-barrel domain
MLINSKELNGFSVHAEDGELGTIEELYFDDDTWGVRYLIVQTGGWLGGRSVLVSPISVLNADWQARHLNVALTKKQVESSPNIETHRPISRQHESTYLGYYGYPDYWGGPLMWGPASYPGGLLMADPATVASDTVSKASTDSHLRSSDAVTGYHIAAADGGIGHVDAFLVDDETWAIRYVEVATRDWWPGKKVLISPAWIERVSWMESDVRVGLTREAIQNAPEYLDAVPVSREYEYQLYLHYGRPPYWVRESAHKSASRSGS